MATITVRIDDETAEALEALTADGTSRSQAVREALLDAARARIRAELVAEARALAEDPADLAEARAVQADLEPLRAW
ncbi:MAG: ribbon-helix-helix protein, CopG family [Acidimicrobiia bacterium]|jgi:Arc/MetJ-type ribon-helix-helix transcriptional regulator